MYLQEEHLLLINDPIAKTWETTIPYPSKTYTITIDGAMLTDEAKQMTARDDFKDAIGKIPIYDRHKNIIYDDIIGLKDEVLINPSTVDPRIPELTVTVEYPKDLFWVKLHSIDEFAPIM